jgi:hypothetical protein
MMIISCILLRINNFISLLMEVTDLKGLKRLMKGDVSAKFEFVEEEGDHDQYNDDDMMFGGLERNAAGQG